MTLPGAFICHGLYDSIKWVLIVTLILSQNPHVNIVKPVLRSHPKEGKKLVW